MAYTHMISYAGKTIETTVTDKPSVADDWVKHIKSKYNHQRRQNIIVSLNCKWSPHPLRSLSNPTATLQLCVGTTCLVLQLLYMNSGIPRSVESFLSDPGFRFVGLEVDEVRIKLRNEYGVDLGNRVTDIRSLARIHFPQTYHYHAALGLKSLAARLLGLPRCCPVTAPWRNLESRVVDNQGVRFVCVDAYVCCRIGERLLMKV